MAFIKASIPPIDVALLESVLEVWCKSEQRSLRDSGPQARILIAEYNKGVRSQIELFDALDATRH